jgi:autotransporter passenger strand-loop-strand repeat protein
MEETDDPVDAGKFANRVCNGFGSGANTRNVRKQGGVERGQAARWSRQE